MIIIESKTKEKIETSGISRISRKVFRIPKSKVSQNAIFERIEGIRNLGDVKTPVGKKMLNFTHFRLPLGYAFITG